jgi:hypothetical protein
MKFAVCRAQHECGICLYVDNIMQEIASIDRLEYDPMPIYFFNLTTPFDAHSFLFCFASSPPSFSYLFQSEVERNSINYFLNVELQYVTMYRAY